MPHESLIPVIDLFAGPGGLGEGFAACRVKGRRAFRIALSIEKNADAHATLMLRSFFRQFAGRRIPEAYYGHLRGELARKELYDCYPIEARLAAQESWQAELGSTTAPTDLVRRRIRQALAGAKTWVLIGGPPCQAYSIAGRSRNRGVSGYALERDERHRLYQEYLRIVADHWPPVFVMENVKGLLSTTVKDEHLFDRMCEDLADPTRSRQQRKRRRYRILSLEETAERSSLDGESVRNFVVRAELHGIPQTRHRVILLGIREDLGDMMPESLLRRTPVPAGDVLKGLPPLRSGVSRKSGRRFTNADPALNWLEVIRRERNKRWIRGNQGVDNRHAVRDLISSTIGRLRIPKADCGGEFVPGRINVPYQPRWYLDYRIGGACNHASRGHMDRDLHRYLFASCFSKVNGRSPRLKDFPPDLLPNHRNVYAALNGGFFNDRFRVQQSDRPATTITSHISKDGHYYVHPDPSQCRALTVREAARIQTFPDNYFFTGNRTEQYTQVGNAVPPFLARQIALVVLGILVRSGLAD